MTGQNDIELLMDGLDDIPTLMELTKTAPASSRRFRGVPNYSLNVQQSMKGSPRENQSVTIQSKKMVWQASKVLQELAKMDDVKKPPKNRELHEIASIAKETLSRESTDRVVGRCDNIFKNYDLSRRGVVTYDDFQQALLAKNAGLTKKETIELAFALDKHKTGVLDYRSLATSLSAIESSSKSQSLPLPASPSSNSYLQNYEQTNSPARSQQISDFKIPPKDGYQRAYELGLRMAEEEKQRERRAAENETRHKLRQAHVDIPSGEMVFEHTCKLPPHTTQQIDATGPDKCYYRSSGRRHSWDTDKVRDLLHMDTLPRRSSSRRYISEHRPAWEDEEETSSYTSAFMKSRGIRPEHSCDGRHITGVGPLSTTVVHLVKGDDVGGPVRDHQRMYAANSANIKNHSSRGFLNSFIIDQARPVRRKRSSSAPPRHSSHTLGALDSLNSPSKSEISGKSLYSQLQRESELHEEFQDKEEEKKSESDAIDRLTTFSYHQRHSNGVIEALHKPDVPTTSSYVDKHGKKKGSCDKSFISDTRTASLQMSMNTLTSQVDSHSKIKVLQDKLNRIDISKSGYANKSELTTALQKSGVHMTPEQISTVFESYVHEGVGVAPGSESSLDLSSHSRGINIKDFVQKLHLRSSAAVVNKTGKRGVPTARNAHIRSATVDVTPIEIEDRVIWKKIINAFEDPHGVSKRSLQFFREAQAKHGNEVPPALLREELNYVGAKLNETEFNNILADISHNSRGMIDIDDFTSELARRSNETKALEKWTALMPSLEETPQSASPHAKTITSLLKHQSVVAEDNKRRYNQRKHFSKSNQESSEKRTKAIAYTSLLSAPDARPDEAEDRHIPACLRIGDTKEYRQERLKWSKLRQTLVDKRGDLLKSFGGYENVSKKLSPQEVRDKMYSAGVILGDDDFSLLCSYASTSSTAAAMAAAHGESKSSGGLNFESICETIGVSTDIDSRKRQVAACREDYQRDGGVFGSSETSLLAHPTYRASILTSSVEDTDLVKGNRRRKYDLHTGKPLQPGGAHDMVPSQFWEMKHVPEIRSLPAELGRGRSRGEVANPTHKYQGTSLRQLQDQHRGGRIRSSSAPPRSSASHSSSASSRGSYMWHKEDNAPISRFASTPLAQYIAMRHNTSPGPKFNASDLNSSIASSSVSHAMNDGAMQSTSEVDN